MASSLNMPLSWPQLAAYAWIPAPCWVLDAGACTVHWANSAALRFWGIASLQALAGVNANSLMELDLDSPATLQLHGMAGWESFDASAHAIVLPSGDQGQLFVASRSMVPKAAALDSALHLLAMANAPEGIIAFDASGSVRYLNACGASYFPDAQQDLLGQKLWEVDAAYSAADWPQFWADIERGDAIVREREFTPVGGETLVLEAITICVHGASGALGYSFLRDVTARKRAEERARQRNTELTRALNEANRLAMVVNRTASAVMLTDELGRIEWVNNAFSVMTGYSAAEAFGRRSSDFLWRSDLVPEAREHVREQTKKNIGVRCEVLNYTRNGDPFWIDLEAQPIRGELGDVTGYTVIGTDITARKQAQAELEASQYRLRAFLNAIPDTIIRVARDGMILDLKAPNVEELPLPPEQLVGKRLFEVLPADLSGRLMACVMAALDQGGTHRLEYSRADLHGMPAVYEARVVAAGSNEVVVISANVTAQHNAQRAIAEAKARLIEAQRVARLGSWECTVDTQRMEWSEEVYRILRWTDGNAKLTVAGFCATIAATDRENFEQKWHAMEHTGQELSMDMRVILADGTSCFVRMLGKPAADIFGHVGRVFGTLQDITEQKLAERAKNEFVSVVSHELRTPLTAIRGALGLLLGAGVGQFDSGTADLLVLAQRNSDRLLHLVNDLLDLDRMAAGKLEFTCHATEVMPLIEQTVAANQPYAERFNIRFAIVQRLENAKVSVDVHRFAQVMANLLSNAAKFSVGDDVGDISGRVTISVDRIDRKVRIRVTDFGIGIPQQFYDKIFEKFSQADASTTRAHGGTGLGLNITRSIVQALGGEIGFTSAEGEGSTFFVVLPEVV